MPDAVHTPHPDRDSRGPGAGAQIGLGAATAILFLLLRVLAVSDWNWTTAEVVVDSLNFGEVLPVVLGTMFSRPDLTGIFLAITLPLTALLWFWPLPGHRRTITQAGLALVLLAATVALVGTTGAWWILAAAAAILVLCTAARRIWRHGRGRDVIHAVLNSTGVIVVSGVLLLSVVVSTPWMPHERFTTQDESIDGYALRVQPGFVTILTDDREIKILPSGVIVSRELQD